LARLVDGGHTSIEGADDLLDAMFGPVTGAQFSR